MDAKQLIMISNVISHAKEVNDTNLEDFVTALQETQKTLKNAKPDTIKEIWATLFKLYAAVSKKPSAKASK